MTPAMMSERDLDDELDMYYPPCYGTDACAGVAGWAGFDAIILEDPDPLGHVEPPVLLRTGGPGSPLYLSGSFPC